MVKTRTQNLNSSFLLNIDVFGIGYNFQVNGRDKFKTLSGVIMTIFYAIIFSALFMGFGIDLYQRKRPKVSSNTKIQDFEEIPLSNKNFTYAYRIEDT